MKVIPKSGIVDASRETEASASTASTTSSDPTNTVARATANSALGKLPRASASRPQIAEGTEVWNHAFFQKTKKPSTEMKNLLEQITQNLDSVGDSRNFSTEDKEILRNTISDLSKLLKKERNALIRQTQLSKPEFIAKWLLSAQDQRTEIMHSIHAFAASSPTSEDQKAKIMRDLDSAAAKLPEAPKN